MKKICFGLTWLLAAMLVIGCSPYQIKEGTYAPVQVRDPNFPGTQIRWNNVSLLDRSIENKIFVETSNSRRTATGTLEVWSILRNRTDYPMQLEARVSFYDADQAPVEGSTAWNRIYLAPNATAHYREYSTRNDIGFYHIEVREGR